MKKLLLLSIFSTSISANAQNNLIISPLQYDLLKQNGQLDQTKNYIFSGTANTVEKAKQSNIYIPNRTPGTICNCIIPLDSTFSVVPFLPGTAPDYRNDDGSSPVISLPFNFSMYGTIYNSVNINNNGNVSFNGSCSTFSSSGFPSNIYTMIAPFWSDVDTRNPLSGLVYYKVSPTNMIVKWDHVGSFSNNADKLNTYQLIITNGTDPILPTGNNVEFCYGDMQWTTGSASGGTGGFGGTPATAGVNKSNGVNYFQIGRFDSAGTAFDGPYNLNDHVDWLDSLEFYFDISSPMNTPPLIIDNVCDTIDVYTGDTTGTLNNFAQFFIGATSPEINQTLIASITCSQPSALTYTQSVNTTNCKQFDCTFSALGLSPGLYYVTITATDNGVPVEQTSKTIVMRVIFDLSLGLTSTDKTESVSVSIYPNPTSDNIIVKHGFSLNAIPILSINNVLGETVLKTKLNTQEQNINISNLKQGVYFATISCSEGKSKAIKIIRK